MGLDTVSAINDFNEAGGAAARRSLARQEDQDQDKNQEVVGEITALNPHNLTPEERAINLVRMGEPAKAFEYLVSNVDLSANPDIAHSVYHQLCEYNYTDVAHNLSLHAPEVLNDYAPRPDDEERKPAHGLDFSDKGYKYQVLSPF